MSDPRLRTLEETFDRLWPLPRSLAGAGFNDSLDILAELMPLQRLTYKSGEEHFGWQVPQEWSVREAYFIDPHGKRHADFKKNNLHLMAYAIPFRGKIPLSELKTHLYSLPEFPRAIPYVTAFYDRQWGFSLSHDELSALPEGEYEVVVDTVLKDGFMVSGESVLAGESDNEVLFSSYLCHPSLANNELSGPLVLMMLQQKIAAMPSRHLTYRFVINAETVGTVCYLARRGEQLKKKLIAGYVVTNIADRGKFHYKRSRRGDSLADRAIETVLETYEDQGLPFTGFNFDPSRGSEERQYCSQGFNLPVGCLMRTVPGKCAEYHTSLDNKGYISFSHLLEAVDVLYAVVCALEENHRWINQHPCCEPYLSRSGLYPTVNVRQHHQRHREAVLWLLSEADGTKDLLEIAHVSRISTALLATAARDLERAGLLVRG